MRLDVTLIRQDVRLRCSGDGKMLRFAVCSLEGPVVVAVAVPLRPVHLLPPRCI